MPKRRVFMLSRAPATRLFACVAYQGVPASASADAAASIHVLTNEGIRPSGALTFPEALRLAPNLEVARVTTGQYAISARGFNNGIDNKLLVLIDGCTVYMPLFSTVNWDAQHLVLQDVIRTEVTSGPGATLWGANTVNGVINVVTRSARDTRGDVASVGAGNQESSVDVRHGIALSTLNMLDAASHVEFGTPATRSELRRSVFPQATWRI